jgi:organic hydroperoxide reductase OsmC/OhrA
MSSHTCTVEWTRGTADFVDGRYPRAHAWRFDGGAVVPGSSSPHSVRVPLSDPAAVDPEEALVAAVSSCHMLWFLSLAAAQGFVVDSYQDAAAGRLAAFPDGAMGIVEVVLHPQVVLSGSKPADDAALAALHHAAHARCNIGQSLRGEVRVQGGWRQA